ncbi:MAG: glycosyltransferase family 2 protein [Lachnospiraceae bacterium]|nr:glycosyltransferase family 2 protein [Lachnospiraceae bacterium]
MDRIAVLIPCYNEELSVEKVIKDAYEALPGAAVYVYDNNSTDRTVEIAEKAGAIVRHEYMQGKGNVVRRMFREVDAECYILVDGDDTYEMSFAGEMAERVLSHQADMVVGDRLSSTYFSENKRPFHNLGNSLVRGSINRLFKCSIRDIMTGFRAFSYQFVKSFPVLSEGFEIETEMTIFAVNNNMQVENVVIGYRDRKEGSVSKLNTYSDGFKVLGTIVRLFREYKPLQFFSLLAAVLALLSLIFIIPVIIEWAKTGLVPRFPTLIVCGFAFVAAIQSLFAGLILNNIARRNRMETELKLNALCSEFREKREKSC